MPVQLASGLIILAYPSLYRHTLKRVDLPPWWILWMLLTTDCVANASDISRQHKWRH